MRILVVEDEAKVSQSICASLEHAGFVPEIAMDGEEAWFKGSTENFSLALLDIGLPKLDGLSVLRKWREEDVTMPVVLLTAKSSWPERVDGIDAGADDYLVKPFHMEELLARIRALIRRSSGLAKSVLRVGDLQIDTRQQRVSEAGKFVNLTSLEFRLLNFLIHNSDRVVSQEELSTHIYYADQEPGSNAVEVAVGRIRKKFNVPVIETRRGFGYILAACE